MTDRRHPAGADLERRVELRSLPFDLELATRDGDAGDGRTLVGRLVPYGVASTVSDGGGPLYRGSASRGAFDRQVRSGQHGQVALFAEHNVPGTRHQLPLARAAELYDGADGLYGAFPMPHTTAADDALELVRAGVVTGLSLGFRLLERSGKPGRDGIVDRTRAHVDHVALTHAPAYATAEVVGLRGNFAAGGALPGQNSEFGRPLAAYRRDLERMRSALER